MIQLTKEELSELMINLFNRSKGFKNLVDVREYIDNEISKVENLALSAVSHRRELLKTVRERNAFNDGYSLGCKTTRKKYEK